MTSCRGTGGYSERKRLQVELPCQRLRLRRRGDAKHSRLRGQQREHYKYTDLCKRIESIKVEPHSYALAHILERVSAREDSKGSGMLSVLVMYKGDWDIRPAIGFFNLAREQGYDLPDKDAEDVFWAKQLEKVYDEHSRRRRFRRKHE